VKARARVALLGVFALCAGLVSTALSGHAGDVRTHTGTINGAAYLIQVPVAWNGTLLLYSHGYVPGQPNPPEIASDPITGAWLLDHGYALAGSSYRRTGWAVEEALQDQVALLDRFEMLERHPDRTIAWGGSLGGLVTAGLVQKFPGRLDGALPMCGVLAGSVGFWNVGLDMVFALKTLLAPGSDLQLVRITDAEIALAKAASILGAAQDTRQGRARLSLVAAVADLPGWIDPAEPEPARDDFETQELNQFLWMQTNVLPFLFLARGELERRAGGNFSWNAGVDYRQQLERSVNRVEVGALYRLAGLSLADDLAALQNAPRITSDSRAVDYLKNNLIFNGSLSGVPVLTLYGMGDGLVAAQHEQAYDSVVRWAGDRPFLRQLFANRAGHCALSAAETIVALETLFTRVEWGVWEHIEEPWVLNAAARALGPAYNVVVLGPGEWVVSSPAFIIPEPSVFLRPFDARS